MKSSDVDSLYNEIRKILIFSKFAEQEGKEFKTEEEIISFQQRAIDCYLGKNEDCMTVTFNKLHAHVERDTHLIMDVIQQYIINKI